MLFETICDVINNKNIIYRTLNKSIKILKLAQFFKYYTHAICTNNGDFAGLMMKHYCNWLCSTN